MQARVRSKLIARLTVSEYALIACVQVSTVIMQERSTFIEIQHRMWANGATIMSKRGRWTQQRGTL